MRMLQNPICLKDVSCATQSKCHWLPPSLVDNTLCSALIKNAANMQLKPARTHGSMVPSGRCLAGLSHLLTKSSQLGMAALKRKNGVGGEVHAEKMYLREKKATGVGAKKILKEKQLKFALQKFNLGCVYVCIYFKVQRIKAKKVLAYSSRSTWLCGCLVLSRC